MVLVASWRDGLFVLGDETFNREFPNQSVRALTPDGGGGALAMSTAGLCTAALRTGCGARSRPRSWTSPHLNGDVLRLGGRTNEQ
jgi:hypothetical protein